MLAAFTSELSGASPPCALSMWSIRSAAIARPTARAVGPPLLARSCPGRTRVCRRRVHRSEPCEHANRACSVRRHRDRLRPVRGDRASSARPRTARHVVGGRPGPPRVGRRASTSRRDSREAATASATSSRTAARRAPPGGGARLFMLAVQHNFIQGRKTHNVIAACLYTAVRNLLIDFSQSNVYVASATSCCHRARIMLRVAARPRQDPPGLDVRPPPAEARPRSGTTAPPSASPRASTPCASSAASGSPSSRRRPSARSPRASSSRSTSKFAPADPPSFTANRRAGAAGDDNVVLLDARRAARALQLKAMKVVQQLADLGEATTCRSARASTGGEGEEEATREAAPSSTRQRRTSGGRARERRRATRRTRRSTTRMDERTPTSRRTMLAVQHNLIQGRPGRTT